MANRQFSSQKSETRHQWLAKHISRLRHAKIFHRRAPVDGLKILLDDQSTENVLHTPVDRSQVGSGSNSTHCLNLFSIEIEEVRALVQDGCIYRSLLGQVIASCDPAARAVSKRIDDVSDVKASKESRNFQHCVQSFKRQIQGWAALDLVSTLCSREAIRDSMLMTHRAFCSFTNDFDSEDINIILHCDEGNIVEAVKTVLGDDSLREKVMSLRGDDAKTILELLQTIISQETHCKESSKTMRETPTSAFTAVQRIPSCPVHYWPNFPSQVDLRVMAICKEGKVALKILRRVPQWRHQNLLLREVVLWQQLRHKHILPFLGACREFGPPLAWVTPWMEHGNVLNFLSRYPGAERLPLIMGVAKGLTYLHQRHLVHGELKGTNVLIDDNHQPRLTDFDLSYGGSNDVSAGTTSVDMHNGLRWMAPEIISPEIESEESEDDVKTFRKTPASDTYSFACVCLEILTGRVPFYFIKQDAVVLVRVLNGERPPRPPINIDDALWDIIDHCMAQKPSQRPLMRDTVVGLRLIGPPTEGMIYDESDDLSSFESTQAEPIAKHNSSQISSPNSRLINLESSTVDATPFKLQVPDLTGQIERIGSRPRRYGGFSEVYVCRSKTMPAQLVAWKILTPHYQINTNDLRRQLLREVLAWHNLVHLNIAPFFGVAYDGDKPGMVGAWFENGTALNYLDHHSDADRLSLIQDVACGLTYLHNLVPPVVHGDLKGSNILVNDDGRAMLSDFGLSRVILAFGRSMVTTKAEKGSLRWQAPELLREWDNKEGRPLRVDMSSDVYSFASVALELITGRVPYYDLKNDGAIIISVVVNNKAPSRPDDINVLAKPKPSDAFWAVLRQCWNFDATSRPSMTYVEGCMILEQKGTKFIPTPPSAEVT